MSDKSNLLESFIYNKIAKKPFQSSNDKLLFHKPKLESNNFSTLNISLLSKKRRPIPSDIVKQRIKSGQWRRQEMVGSSLRFQYFDELMEGEKSLELIVCRLCDSAYSIHSRSHCLDHIKQRHPEVNFNKLLKNKLDDHIVNNNDINLNKNCNKNDKTSQFITGNENYQNNSKIIELNQKCQNFENESIVSPVVKRRRLITTEMAKSRLQAGDWQLKSVTGASVRCRFFYEIYEGNAPLNTLSCKLCGATYSTQSRSHYREHVRKRHSEVYCVRNGRISTSVPTVIDKINKMINEINNKKETKNDEDQFLNNLQNVSRFKDFKANSIDLITSNSLIYENTVCNMPPNPQLKMRRIITTETVINHLEAGDWSRKPISGMSIRSRFFDEIVKGEEGIPLNILICKLCSSTYSAQSRSHCVEHVKKRHQSILEGNKDADDFKLDAWMDTQKIVNLSEISIQNYEQKHYLPIKSYFNEKYNQTFLHQQQVQKTQKSSQRKRKFLIPVCEPDQTIETPSIDSILQSLATQALSQDVDSIGENEENYIKLNDEKKNFLTINNIINKNVINNDTVTESQNQCQEEEIIQENNAKEKEEINDVKNDTHLKTTNTLEFLNNNITFDTDIKQLFIETNHKNLSVNLLSPTSKKSRVNVNNFESKNKLKPSILSENSDTFNENFENSESFCKNCKSEFPNVVRNLNQLYSQVNDLIEIMHLALNSIQASQPHNLNIAKALEKLKSATILSDNAVDGFANTKNFKNLLAKTNLKNSNEFLSNLTEKYKSVSVFENNNNLLLNQIEEDEKFIRLVNNKHVKNLNDVKKTELEENFNICRDNYYKNNLYKKNFDDDDELKNLEEEMHNEEQMDPVLKALLNNETSSNDEDEINNEIFELKVNKNQINNQISVLEKTNKSKLEMSNIFATSSKMHKNYLSFLEKEILKCTPNEFTIDQLHKANSIIKKAQSNKVMSALKNLTSRGLIEIFDGQNKFFKNNKKIQQFC